VISSSHNYSRLDGTLAQRVLAEQIKIVMRQAPKALAASVPLAAIGALVLWSDVAHGTLLAAIFLVCAASLWWLTFCMHYKRNPRAIDLHDWTNGATLRSAILGCCWGIYSITIFVPNSVGYQAFDVAFMYSLTSGAVAARGAHYRSFAVFVLPTLLPVVILCFFEGTMSSAGVGFGGIIALLYTLFAGLSSNRVTETSIQIRFENLDLMRELEKQKEIAERERFQAEAANVSKSRFLAAASHDLRQPIHTLGLFVAAAKHPTTAQEHALIIDRIESAVGSLAALFDSLLDISRLDAGILQAQIKIVALRPILQKLATEYGLEANAKNLKFRFRCPDIAVRTDPLLLERMIRNLVSNALRYTNTGGVLVGSRRRGTHLRIEVWDTGIGIAPDKQGEVFEEFYQIGNAERDRRRGVGLGLAIVKRIAALLQHPIWLISRLGSGSRFGIDVPIAPIHGQEADLTNRIADDDESVLLGTVIVAIDDEADILAALELLLKQWGCVVFSADCGAQAQDKLQRAGVIPDFILSDYRLRNDETGVGAIQALRATYGDAIPALLVTGDTAVERLRDAAASGLDVLHKPVNADQLKQALIKLLRPELASG
jgi:two-component system, sensor histidine kinase